VIERLRWRSLPDGRLEIDYLQPDGRPETCTDGTPFRRHRSTATAISSGAPKYVSPNANGCRIYHAHTAIAAGNYSARLNDCYTPLRITEGELKTEAASHHDTARITIGLGGVNSWRDHRDGGEHSQPLPELQALALNGREVRLCFDSDLQKPQVRSALQALAEWLAEQGALVLVEVLPNGLDGQRLGLDDLIHRHGAAAFLEIAAIARCPFKAKRRDGKDVQVWAFNPEPANTRERNAYLFGLHGQHWRRSDDGREHWQHWWGTHWERLPSDEHLFATIEQFAALQQWQNRELGNVRSLAAAFRRSINPPADGAGTAGLVPFRNGCLRLCDLQLIAHDREHGNTWSLPYDFNAAAASTAIEAFLSDRLVDADTVAVFRAFARHLLVGDPLKCFLEISGASNTGKSVLANLLVALVGSSNTAAMTLQRLEDRQQRFETLKLRGRRLALFSECQDYSGQLQTLKAITGGDRIAAEIKGGRHLDFSYRGGVVLVGNGPIRASDPSGAVINRRRSLPVNGVIAAADELVLIESDGAGGWRGDLVPELPGLVNWCLAMPAADARAALARDVPSLARAEAELATLLDSDAMADWADQMLAWSDSESLQVGVADGDPTCCLFPSYLRFIEQQGRNARPLSMKLFKLKLIDLLRDTLSLPLPAGCTRSGPYRERSRGSVVPCLQWREVAEPDANGIIRHAFLRRVENGRERHGNGKTPAGNGWNGRNGSETLGHKGKRGEVFSSPMERSEPQPHAPVPSVPHNASCRSAAVPTACRSVPVEVLNAKTGQWEPGWQQITTGSGSGSVLCSDPAGCSRLVERKRIRTPACKGSDAGQFQ
jgi:hypothetical protein